MQGKGLRPFFYCRLCNESGVLSGHLYRQQLLLCHSLVLPVHYQQDINNEQDA